MRLIRAVLLLNCTEADFKQEPKSFVNEITELVKDARRQHVPVYVANIKFDVAWANQLNDTIQKITQYEIDFETLKLPNELIQELKDKIGNTQGRVLVAGLHLLPHVFDLTFNGIDTCFVKSCAETGTHDGIDGEVFDMYFGELTEYKTRDGIFDLKLTQAQAA